MKPLFPFGIPIGITIAVWSIIGILRFFQESFSKIKFGRKSVRHENEESRAFFEKISSEDVACVVPAHNEEFIIKRTISSLKQSLKPSQIYVVSDGSADKTASHSRSMKVHVSELKNGIGKANAISYTVKKYNLCDRYKFIFIMDADTQLDINYINGALKMFEDNEIKVVYAAPHIYWPDHLVPQLKYYFIAYRERLNQILRYMMQYGQTWKYTNVTYVIPGYCTIYRSEIFAKIPINTPGLLIEDFNTAFFFHKNKMGKVGFHPSLIAWDQHPANLEDYWKQVKRWNIGFFQTVRYNGIWPSWFWLTLGIFSIEVFLHSAFLLFLPLTIFFLVLPYLGFSDANGVELIQRTYFSLPIIGDVSFAGLFFRVFIFDYLFSIAIGWMIKKPQFVVYGLFFIFLHVITSLILVVSIFPGFFSRSQGKWNSPRRHTLGMESVKI